MAAGCAAQAFAGLFEAFVAGFALQQAFLPAPRTDYFDHVHG